MSTMDISIYEHLNNGGNEVPDDMRKWLDSNKEMLQKFSLPKAKSEMDLSDITMNDPSNVSASSVKPISQLPPCYYRSAYILRGSCQFNL